MSGTTMHGLVPCPLRASLPLLGLLLAGCPIGNDRYPKPDDLTPSWRLDRLRVLGVRAEPPELRPGETATFEALVIDPHDERGAVVWLACPPEDEGGIGFGCGLDPSFDFGDASPDELAEAGFIGFEPLLPPRYRAPDDALDGPSGDEAADRRYVLVQVAVLPGDALDAGAGGFDFNEVEVAYKRLVVSTADVPNKNPVISGFTVDGVPVPAGAVLEVDPDQVYAIGLAVPPHAAETYVHTNGEGVAETRTEEPYATWYATDGVVQERVTLWGYLEADWRSPQAADATSGTIWAVLRDRRGGQAWAHLDWRVR